MTTTMMRKILAALLLGVTALAQAGETSLLRTTLTVTDVDRSLAFYALLGFAAESDIGGERSPDSPFPLNSRSTQWRLVILAPASGQGGKIGLLWFDQAPPAPVRDMRRTSVGLGDMVFVLDVADAAAVHAQLAAAGTQIVEEPVTFRSRNLRPDGSPMEGRVFHVFDPDGYLIEILQAAR